MSEYGNDESVSIEHILDLYPEAREFSDLIHATTVEDFISVGIARGARFQARR